MPAIKSVSASAEMIQKINNKINPYNVIFCGTDFGYVFREPIEDFNLPLGLFRDYSLRQYLVVKTEAEAVKEIQRLTQMKKNKEGEYANF